MGLRVGRTIVEIKEAAVRDKRAGSIGLIRRGQSSGTRRSVGTCRCTREAEQKKKAHVSQCGSSGRRCRSMVEGGHLRDGSSWSFTVRTGMEGVSMGLDMVTMQ